MKINIGNKNKIKNANIGSNNKIEKENKSYIVEIIVGIIVTVVGGIILYILTMG